MKVEQALELLKKYNHEEFHIVHGKTVSGVMGYFASKYDAENVEYWQVVGMLHDIDFELYPNEHCVKCMEIFEQEGVSVDIAKSCASHGYGLCQSEIEPIHIMEKVLFATDELTGLIGAAARMRPSKSVSDMELS
ncbi:MAG: hydrolase, partial [Clostridia bacterium]